MNDVPVWLGRAVIAFTILLALLILGSSLVVLDLSITSHAPIPPKDISNKDAVDAYVTLAAAQRQQLTDIYQAVVVGGILPMFSALVTGVVAYILIPKAIKEFRKL